MFMMKRQKSNEQYEREKEKEEEEDTLYMSQYFYLSKLSLDYTTNRYF